jgi:hypothetical protein
VAGSARDDEMVKRLLNFNFVVVGLRCLLAMPCALLCHSIANLPSPLMTAWIYPHTHGSFVVYGVHQAELMACTVNSIRCLRCLASISDIVLIVVSKVWAAARYQSNFFQLLLFYMSNHRILVILFLFCYQVFSFRLARFYMNLLRCGKLLFEII